jgi:eukaryotic-like serine/threonine-protein kinase
LTTVGVDPNLLNEALSALSATELGPLKDGGQKTVRRVDVAGNELVMKVIALDSNAPEALRRAQREVELLKSIDNDHVVKVASDLTEIGVPPRGVAWLEEYLEGDDLGDLLGAQWDWADAKEMAIQVARGLGALHDVKVVHRDLSANNVRRTTAGRYVVMDPGFARHTLRSGLTVGGQPGTPGFFSPEHLQSFSGAPTASSDVFCVGILVFVALTGYLPIPYNGDPADYLARLGRVEVLDIDGLRPGLPDDVKNCLAGLLHAQPARRPRNGNRLVQELEVIA